MELEIDFISNGWVVKHDVTAGLWKKQMFFKTLGHAIAYSKRVLDKYKGMQN